MPYYKRRYKPRRTYRRRKRRYGNSIAKKALSLARYNKRRLKQEWKHWDTNQGTLGITSTPDSQCISLIAQGDDDINRTGNSIAMRSIIFNALLNSNFASVPVNNVLIQLVYAPWDCNGGNVNFGDVMDTNDITSNRNMDTTEKYKVLWRERYTLTESGRESIMINKYKKMNKPCKFDLTTGVIAACTSGHYFLQMLSTQATDEPTITYNCRVRFTDS